MIIKIAAGGMGIGIPKINTQVGGLLECFIYLNDELGQGSYMQIGKYFSLDRKNSTIGFAGIETEWITLDPNKDRWLFNPWHLAKEHIAEVNISSGSIIATQVDISVKVYHENRLKHQIELYGIRADGSLFSNLNVRGDIHVCQMNPQYLNNRSSRIGVMR
jgi:hypothetical protein